MLKVRGLQTKSGLCGSCPNLVDCESSNERPLDSRQKPSNKTFISNMLLNFHVDIFISSAEAEDIAESSKSLSDMLPRYRQRSQSLDKVRKIDVSGFRL